MTDYGFTQEELIQKIIELEEQNQELRDMLNDMFGELEQLRERSRSGQC